MNELTSQGQRVDYMMIWHRFIERGCSAFGVECNPQGKRAEGVALVYELLGDDVDGAAAMIEDMGL